MKGKRNCYSGIGGQAVLEGIMMKNQEEYAVAVRKPDGKIIVEMGKYPGILNGSRIMKIPFMRGIFNFIDSLVLGMRCLNFSASFYEEEVGTKEGLHTNKSDKTNRSADESQGTEDENQEGKDENQGGKDGNQEEKDENRNEKAGKGSGDKLMTAVVTCFAIVLAIGLFVVLPYLLASLLGRYVLNRSLLTIIEGVIRIVIFILYVWGISAMKDIKRLYRYHGAEHKCINCIERGKPLTVRNVMRSSRLHKRCGTSFLFFVLFVSIILMFFISVENPLARIAVRVLLMPVVAGISYEIIRLAGRSDNILVRIVSAPGMAIQRMTTKEPDESMVEVAIAAVEAVFDWKKYLQDNFGYEEEAYTEEPRNA